MAAETCGTPNLPAGGTTEPATKTPIGNKSQKKCDRDGAELAEEGREIFFRKKRRTKPSPKRRTKGRKLGERLRLISDLFQNALEVVQGKTGACLERAGGKERRNSMCSKKKPADTLLLLPP